MAGGRRDGRGGYELAFLFDHRLTAIPVPDPRRVSCADQRLRRTRPLPDHRDGPALHTPPPQRPDPDHTSARSPWPDPRPVVVHVATIAPASSYCWVPSLSSSRRLRRRGRVGARSLRFGPRGGGHPAHRPASRNAPCAPGHDLLVFRELLAVFQRVRPDIVHTHTPKPGVFGRLAAGDSGTGGREHGPRPLRPADRPHGQAGAGTAPSAWLRRARMPARPIPRISRRWPASAFLWASSIS